MKRYVLFSLTVLLLVASFFGCVADPMTSVNMNTTSLKELVIDSENSLKSYSITLSDSENVAIVDSVSGKTTFQVNILNLGAGAVNRTDKSVKVVTASLVLPVGDVANANTASSEVYLVNDTLYRKVDGNWTMLKLTPSVGLGTSQDRIGQSAMLLNASTIRLVGVEAIDGEMYYVVEISPQSSAVSSLIKQELGSNISMISQDVSSLFNNAQLKYVLWINMASHLPAQEFALINMMATPETLGYPGGNRTEIYINSTVVLRFGNFNKTINIELPEAAKRAEMLPLNSTGTSASYPALFASSAAQDPPSNVNSSTLSPEAQQMIWLAEAYRFLNGGYYPNFSPTYSFPYMPYSPYFNPYHTYSPSYSPTYNMFYTPYYSPFYGPYYGRYYSSYLM